MRRIIGGAVVAVFVLGVVLAIFWPSLRPWNWGKATAPTPAAVTQNVSQGAQTAPIRTITNTVYVTRTVYLTSTLTVTDTVPAQPAVAQGKSGAVTSDATPTPAVATAVNAQACTGIHQGPWAPSASGEGQSFEVTCNELVCASTRLSVWWPHGETPWENKEALTIVPAGLSITVINGAGDGTEYSLSCSAEQIGQEGAAHAIRRATDTSFHDFVPIEELITAGLVEVRFDRRATSARVAVTSPVATPTPAPATAAQPAAPVTTCAVDRLGDAETTTVAPAVTWSVEAWGDRSGLLIGPAGTLPAGLKGALWGWTGCTTAEVMVIEQAAGKNPRPY